MSTEYPVPCYKCGSPVQFDGQLCVDCQADAETELLNVSKVMHGQFCTCNECIADMVHESHGALTLPQDWRRDY